MIRAAKQILKACPGVRAFLETNAWRSFRHQVCLRVQARVNDTFTRFLRVPMQFEALCGPVVDFLLPGGSPRPLTIIVLGCSNGAEVYSIASILRSRRPDVTFTVHGYDIDGRMIRQAERASYASDEVLANTRIPAEFVRDTFDIEGDLYRVKRELARYAHFGIADVLDPQLTEHLGTADIVYAQNFLYHLKPRIAGKAFDNLCRLLNPKAALFIDGMDLGMRGRLTRRHGLTPLSYRIEAIHNDARVIRGSGWSWNYWGLEPFSSSRHDWERRYGTIFLCDRATVR